MPAQSDTRQFGSKNVAWGKGPKENARSFPLTLDFTKTAGLPIVINLQEQVQQNFLEWVQTVYADNSASTVPLTLTDSITGQAITWPAGRQGYLPFLCGDNVVFTASVSSGQPVVNIQLVTVPMPPAIWATAASTQIGSVSLVGSVGTDNSVAKPAAAANLLTTVALNANRNFLEVQNQSADQLQLFLDDGAGAQVSVVLLESAGANIGGGSWTSSYFKGRMRIFGPNPAVQLMAREY